MSVAAAPPASRASALAGFVRSVYAPGLHGAYAAAWFLGLDGLLALVDGGARWRLDLGVPCGIGTLFLVLFVLRVVDELKDLDYDRVHNPDRPLVRGAVTPRDLALFIGGSALLAACLSAPLSPALAALALGDVGYGLFLLFLERRWARLRDDMFLNLALTYPVNVALSVYTIVFFVERQGGAVTSRGALLFVAFVLAFLHYEVARKTAWPHLAKKGERLYSIALGGRGSVALASFCALGSCAILLALVRPWATAGPIRFAGFLALMPLVPAALGATRFLGTRERRVKLAGLAMVFLVLFYGGSVAIALAGNALDLSAWRTP